MEENRIRSLIKNKYSELSEYSDLIVSLYNETKHDEESFDDYIIDYSYYKFVNNICIDDIVNIINSYHSSLYGDEDHNIEMNEDGEYLYSPMGLGYELIDDRYIYDEFYLVIFQSVDSFYKAYQMYKVNYNTDDMMELYSSYYDELYSLWEDLYSIM